ncbi:MAG: tetratricopeptide repeat protein [Candidatus Omnitrophota bacterium]
MEYGDKIFSFSNPLSITGFFILAAMLFFAFKLRKKFALISFVIFWFLITLSVHSNIYPIKAYMAEHWLYIPSVGFFIVTAKGLFSVKRIKALRILPFIAVSFLVIFYIFLTVRQNNYWREPIAFYKRTLEYAPKSRRANNDLAIAYQKEERYGESIEIYKKLINSFPDESDTYVNLAAVYVKTGNYKEALLLCKKAIEIEPNNATAHNNLAVAYYTQELYNLAVSHCDIALRLGYRVKPEFLELLELYREQNAGK